MIQAKEYSNKICEEYGLSLTEAKATRYNMPKWKRKLKSKLDYAMKHSSSKAEFIFILERLGVTVNWQENRKYITFTTDDKHKAGIISCLMRDFSKKILKYILNLAVATALFQKSIKNTKHRKQELYQMLYSI